MDSIKVGSLLLRLRKEKGMTQKQVGDFINVSDKTISKWERGLGCPDISLLRNLSDLYEVDIDKLLQGELEPNLRDSGNLKRIKFYVCPLCSNVITNSGNGKVSCCGRKLLPLKGTKADKMHPVQVEELDDEYFITFQHEMSKTHYISFVAHVTGDRMLLLKLYPEQSGNVRISKSIAPGILKRSNGRLYFYCNQHGLFEY